MVYKITINVDELLQAWSARDGAGVIGCNCADVVVEARLRRTKYWPTVFHGLS